MGVLINVVNVVLNYLQFCGFNVSNISLIFHNEDGWWLHASTEKIDLDGCFVHRTHSLMFAVNLKEVHVSAALENVILPTICINSNFFTALQMKMLKHKHSSKTVQPCLAEFSFGINIDGTFDSSKNITFDVSYMLLF